MRHTELEGHGKVTGGIWTKVQGQSTQGWQEVEGLAGSGGLIWRVLRIRKSTLTGSLVICLSVCKYRALKISGMLMCSLYATMHTAIS